MSGQQFTAAGCVLIASCGVAAAFYPPPSLIDRPVTVLPVPVPIVPAAPPGVLTPVPPVPPPDVTRPPVPVIPQDTPNPPRPTVPEPASFVVAATGLAAIAAVRRRKLR